MDQQKIDYLINAVLVIVILVLAYNIFNMRSGFETIRDDRQCGAVGEGYGRSWQTPANLNYNLMTDSSAVSHPDAANLTSSALGLTMQARDDRFKNKTKQRFTAGAGYGGMPLQNMVVGAVNYRNDPRDVVGQTTSDKIHVPTDVENALAKTAYGH